MYVVSILTERLDVIQNLYDQGQISKKYYRTYSGLLFKAIETLQKEYSK